MRRAATLLALCVLPACSVKVRTGPLPAEHIPAAFQGSWKGTGSQSDHPGVEWTIALTLGGGAPGDVVGTITYPSLACGGDLILRGGNGRGVELLERITFGTCVDRGVITLASAHELSFDWRDDAGLEAHGSLSRATPPAE